MVFFSLIQLLSNSKNRFHTASSLTQTLIGASLPFHLLAQQQHSGHLATLTAWITADFSAVRLFVWRTPVAFSSVCRHTLHCPLCHTVPTAYRALNKSEDNHNNVKVMLIWRNLFCSAFGFQASSVASTTVCWKLEHSILGLFMKRNPSDIKCKYTVFQIIIK